MQLGVGLPSFASDHARVPAQRLVDYSRRVEAEGFAGAWVLDHLHPPSLYRTSWLDPLTTLATVAGATDSIPLGTSILILPLRDPVLTARRTATLHHLSDERLTLGVGLGSDADEYDIVGVDHATRSKRFTEALEVLYRLLHEDEVSFDGEFFDLDAFSLEPSLPNPPRVIAGGGGVRRDDGVRRVARAVKDRVVSVDGWVGAPWTPDVIETDWTDISDHAEATGRDPETLDRLLATYVHIVPDADADRAETEQRRVLGEFVESGGVDFAYRNYLTGTVDDIRDQLAAYEALGIQETVVFPVAEGPAAQDRQLDLLADLVKPHFR